MDTQSTRKVRGQTLITDCGLWLFSLDLAGLCFPDAEVRPQLLLQHLYNVQNNPESGSSAGQACAALEDQTLLLCFGFWAGKFTQDVQRTVQKPQMQFVEEPFRNPKCTPLKNPIIQHSSLKICLSNGRWLCQQVWNFFFVKSIIIFKSVYSSVI